MQLRLEGLTRHLEKPLQARYLLAGDEPLLLLEAADSIRAAAKAQHYDERLIFDVNSHLDWHDVRYAAQAMGLFASRRLIELRFEAAKLDKLGNELLSDWAANPPSDTVVLLTVPEWKKEIEKLSWVRICDQAGIVVPIWPIKREELGGWLAKRARALNIQIDPEASERLAELVEGNLLAAKQELDQLELQHGKKRITLSDVQAQVADSAHFNTFGLVDAALHGDAARTVRVMRALAAEGEESFMILSWLVRQLELMPAYAAAQARGELESLFNTQRVWPARQTLYKRALKRADLAQWQCRLIECAQVDQTIKGRRFGNGWLELERLLLRVALPAAQGARFSAMP